MATQTPKERLLIFAQYLRIGQNKLENAAGLGRGSISHAGDTITGKMLRKIVLAYPQLNPEWILLGKGDMLINSEDATKNNTPNYADEIVNLNEGIASINRKLDAILNILKDAQK